MSSSSASVLGATSQRERQRAETRERLFEAAVAEFKRVGFGAAQIPAIAESVGVVRGTFYFHFPSKEHVLLELVGRRQAELASRLAALRGRGASVDAVLEGLMDAMEPEEGEEAAPELVREIVVMQLRAPLEPDDDPREHAVFIELAALFEELAARGQLRTDIGVEPLAAMVLTSVFGLTVARGTAAEEDRLASPDQLMALLLPGLRPGAV
jgi:AcrR family transcriptional regulator